MRSYIGERNKRGRLRVWVDLPNGKQRPINPRFDLRCYSPSGFDSGNTGEGSAQLALAILADYLGDEEEALQLHAPFLLLVVSGLNLPGGWYLPDEQISIAVALLRMTANKPLVPL